VDEVQGLRVPLFVKPDEPLLIFQAAESAVHAIEWQDLEPDPYRGFDADGRPFVLEAVTWESKPLFGRIRRVDGRVALRVVDSEPQPKELRELLVRALLAAEWGSRDALEGLSFDELRAAAVDRYGIE
jgi:hypothetical protein